MGDKQVKRLRKQLRNVVEELIPSVLTVELIKAGHERLKIEVDAKLDVIDKNLKETLKTIDDRSKDTMSYLLRSVKPTTVPTENAEDEKA